MTAIHRPLLEKLIAFNQKETMSFHVPGHKYGMLSGMPVVLRSALSFDVTELTGLDDLHEPSGVIKEAQERLSNLYKSDASYFLVNGSTVGNLAMIYATCSAGDTVIVQRNAHKSIFNALELVGAKLVLLTPKWNEQAASIGVVSENQIGRVLALYPEAKAVVLTYPTYYGTTGEGLKAIISLCHKREIPVLVDEAHGAHFVVGGPFPSSALALGADIVVHSAHKTLPAMTMGSFLHIKSSLVSQERVEKYLQMLQSSSPSYLLMASLDDARAYAESFTQKDIEYFLKMREVFIDQLKETPGLRVILSDDPLKLMIRYEKYSGFQLLDALEKEGIYAELADPYQVLLILPLLKVDHIYEQDDVNHKIERAVISLRKNEREKTFPQPMEMSNEITELCYNEIELEKFQTDWLYYDEAIGKIAAASIIPYPPGIPLLLAGERVCKEEVALLSTLTNMNAKFQGAIRPKEKQILVVINEVGE